jgi:dTDP-4-dehydrorhamnose reductase
MPSGLVVGADGTIGRALLATLRAGGWQACGTTRRADARDGLAGLDLADFPDRSLRGLSLDALPPPLAAFLLAAVTGYDRCAKDPAATRVINVDHTLEIARLLVQRGAFVLFPSSSAVFGDYGARAPGEGDLQQPATEYGRQKVAAEQGISRLATTAQGGAGTAIVRIAKVVHAGDRFGTWMKSLANGSPVEAAGDIMLAPVSTAYVARGMIGIAQRRESGTYHLSGAQDVSYFDFARLLARALGCSDALVRRADVRAAGGPAVPASGRLELGDGSRRAGLELQAVESAVADLVMEFREES